MVSINDTVADEVCRLLKRLQAFGGDLSGIEMKSIGGYWKVIVTIVAPSRISSGDQVVTEEVIVESFDVAQAVATAVAGRYNQLGKPG